MICCLPFFLATELSLFREEHVVHCSQRDNEEGGPYENEDEEAVAMIEESHSGP